MNLIQKIEAYEPWVAPPVDRDIPQGDVPGAHIDIFPGNFEQSEKLFVPLLKMVKDLASYQEKIVISVSGGSGVGKTGIASILTHYFNEMGIGAYMLSGDNYPHRIPVYNDAERVHLFREGAIKGLVKAGEYQKERFEIIQKFQRDFTDADPNHTQKYPWFQIYLDAGRKALEGYLGTDKELNFEEVNEIIYQFKASKDSIFLKRLGRKETELWYDSIDFSHINILIIEWTHGNSDYLKGVDIPIFLNSTPKETLEFRRLRGKDGQVDSPFVTMVLEIEQELLHHQAHKGKLILSKGGELLSFEEYQDVYQRGRL